MNNYRVIARVQSTRSNLVFRDCFVASLLAMTCLMVQSVSAAENAADSKKFYEAAVRAQPNNSNAQYDLGNVYFMEERYVDALACYLEAGSLGLAAARMGNYYFNISVCYAKLGNMDEAIRSVEACLKIEPDRKNAKDLLGIYKNKLE